MRAEDLLRRYLEQRRDAGERELILDDLSVDDVMRLLGAPRRSAEADAGGWRDELSPPAVVAERRAPSDESAVVPLERRASSGEPTGASAAASLDELAALVRDCRACSLHATAKHPVPGDGAVTARFMCVGEAPGAQEDETGHPFVGQAGQLLTKILAAVELKREDVYIANVLKHRPPGNRPPTPDEVKACMPFLLRQIELVKPAVILALGLSAAQALLDTKDALGKLRGREHLVHGIPVIVTYHPAALLRNPAWKRPTWEDVQLARRILDRTAVA